MNDSDGEDDGMEEVGVTAEDAPEVMRLAGLLAKALDGEDGRIVVYATVVFASAMCRHLGVPKKELARMLLEWPDA